MADWIEILKEQREQGERMRREVPRMLAAPAIALGQVMALFAALEKQAGFVEKLVEVLDGNGYEPDVVTAAERLEGLYAELAEVVAEKARAMRQSGSVIDLTAERSGGRG
jgi:hypothetical protein